MAQPLDSIIGLDEAINDGGPPIVCEYTLPVTRLSLENRVRVRGERPGEVVLLVRRPADRFLVHTKGHYPSGTYRLLSGGIRWNEALLPALHREALEEIGRRVQIDRFLGLLHYRFTWQDRAVPFFSCLFIVHPTDGLEATPMPTDLQEGIANFHDVPLAAFSALASHLESLASAWGPEANWADWGRFRAIAHRFAAEVLASDG